MSIKSRHESRINYKSRISYAAYADVDLPPIERCTMMLINTRHESRKYFKNEYKNRRRRRKIEEMSQESTRIN